MITPSDRVLDLGLAMEETGGDGGGWACVKAEDCYGKVFGSYYGGGWAPPEGDRSAVHRTTTIVKRCSRARRFPISPAAFNAALEGCVFTNGADAEFVKGKYAKTFQEVVAEAGELRLANCGFNADLATLEPTLRVGAQRLRTLDLSLNGAMTGDLSAVSVCPRLEHFNL